MEFNLKLLEELLKNKKVEIQPGVFICCDEGVIKPTILLKGGDLVIQFDAPFTYLHVEKLGPKKLLNLVKPRIESVRFTEKSILAKLSSLGEWEFERNNL